MCSLSRLLKLLGPFCLLVYLTLGCVAHAGDKKGLLVYGSIYGSTVETAYWIKAIIGHAQNLDVKALNQVITIAPYDYVIIGSATRNEKPLEVIYDFVEANRAELVKKQVCYYLTCGDSDETMVLNIPGKAPHLIGGRNYLADILKKFPDIQPVLIGAFGGRQVMPRMGTKDSLTLWLVGTLAKEGAPWQGLDIWESLVPERVEAFANDVRVNILGMGPRNDVEQFRGFWQSQQPASLTNIDAAKYSPKPYCVTQSLDKSYFTRSRIRGDLSLGTALLKQWAQETGAALQEQSKTEYNEYYHAVKSYGGTEITIHIVTATLPQDPGNLHISFRCYEKMDERSAAEKDISRAEKLLWADGRKVDQ